MNLTIKDMPQSERPRERLSAHGPSALSNSELVAIILRTGTRGQTALEVANRLLGESGLGPLSGRKAGELARFHGVGAVKACQLVACFELGRRAASACMEGQKIRNGKDVASLLSPQISGLKKEHFVGLYLDCRNNLLKKETVAIGSLNTSIIHPREVFKVALEESAASIIIAHNHPSGDPSPSEADVSVTRKLVETGRIMGISVLDHVVIGRNSFFSMADEGLI